MTQLRPGSPLWPLLLMLGTSCAASAPALRSSPPRTTSSLNMALERGERAPIALQDEVEQKPGHGLMINLVTGPRTMENDFWGELGLDDQAVLGLEITGKPDSPAFSPEIGFFYGFGSKDLGEGVKLVSDSFSIDLGLRYTYPIGGFMYPYAGGGVSMLQTSFRLDLEGDDQQSQEADDAKAERAFGGYYHGGVYFKITDTVNLGVDYRVLGGASYKDIEDFDADYTQFLITLGFSK